MRYQIGICDDDPVWCNLLSKIVISWAKQRNNPIQIICFKSAEEFLFQEAEKTIQILLLDIEMKKMNGVELAGKIRQKNKEIQIIFITGYMDYIQDGYEVEALHYLLKPITEEKLSLVLDRAAEHLQFLEKSLLFTIRGETIRIPLHKIRYLEVQKNYVTIHAQEDYEIKQTLQDLERNLDDGFCRTSRSFIVNLHYIKRITKQEVILNDGTKVPLSRGMYHSINQAMIHYF